MAVGDGWDGGGTSVLAERARSEGARLGEERVLARSGGRVRMGRAVQGSFSLPA